MNIIYKIAESESEKAAARKLIEYVFVKELGYSKIKPDKFDDIAVFLITKFKGQIIAALRLIPDSEIGLPLDAHTDLSELRNNSKKLSEVSRLACLKDFRNNQVSLNGISFLKQVLDNMGVTHVVVDSFLHSARLYKQFGFKPVGKPIFDPTIFKVGADPDAPNSRVMFAKVKELTKKELVTADNKICQNKN